jgi:hypothetical protein
VTDFPAGPEAALLGETTAERPFLTVEIETTVAERAKTTYPRDMQQIYCGPQPARRMCDEESEPTIKLPT